MSNVTVFRSPGFYVYDDAIHRYVAERCTSREEAEEAKSVYEAATGNTARVIAF
jgi:hypothetical protein